jgi:predicted amidohydrolase YtcJ
MRGGPVTEAGDVVVRGGVVFSPETNGTARHGPATVVVAGGRIAAVLDGGEGEGDWIGPSTRVIDVPGCLVLPGFQDSHVHPHHGGAARARCELHEVRGIPSYEDVVRTYASSHPEAPWILGGGWSLDDFPGGTPSRSILDAIVPERPVFLTNRDGHGAWVNSRALEVAGVTRDTPDPVDGRIEREADGSPLGTLQEGAMDLVESVVPVPTQEETEAAVLEGQRYLHSLGITAWQDAWVTPPVLEAYRALAERGELTARVVAALWWERELGEEQIEGLLAQRSSATLGRLRATSVKIMQDGICENFTAAMTEPYLDADGHATDSRGLSFVEPELLKRAVVRLDREGFQVHVHAIGDRAVREALDAFEAARAAGGDSDARHHIAHIQVVHPADVARFAELGVVANGQPYWAALDGQMVNLTIPFLGPERTAQQYPFASLLRSGARLAFGSDWPVSTPNPLKEIEVAVTRKPDGEPDREVFLPDERVSVQEALTAFSAGSAYVNHLDGETGSLEAGKLADLTVLDRDVLSGASDEIGRATCLMTMVEGEIVFEGA